LVLALTVLAGCALILPSTSGANGSSSAIVCPLMSGAIIPCCGPPQAARDSSNAAAIAQPICCSGALCIQSLTIASSPNPSHANGKVTISGQVLRTATGTSPTITLWQQLPGQKQFAQMIQTSVDANGKYTVTRRANSVQTNREWYASANGVRSQTLTQSVEAVVTLTAAHGRQRLTKLSGQVTPSHKGDKVLLQRRAAHGWITIGRPRLSQSSRFKLTHRLAKGAVMLRVVLPADAENALSLSRTVTVRTG
jgi:hypothetical protein